MFIDHWLPGLLVELAELTRTILSEACKSVCMPVSTGSFVREITTLAKYSSEEVARIFECFYGIHELLDAAQKPLDLKGDWDKLASPPSDAKRD